MASFLVNQQLPQAFAIYLTAHGHNAKHVKEYPHGSTLPDADVTRIADAEGRIVVTKDDDFRVSHLLANRAARLLHITCGNISTSGLLALVAHHYSELAVAVKAYDYIEINQTDVIIHDQS